MKNNHEHPLDTPIIVPHIVDEKLEDAFDQIKKGPEMKKNTVIDHREMRRKSRFPKSAVAAACAGLIALAGVTAYAAITHFWYQGTAGALQASEADQQKLSEKGMAVVTGEMDNYEEMAVTSNGITITPETIITDGVYAHLVFSILGVALEEGDEPAIENLGFYLGEDPNAEDAWLNYSGVFYDGIVSNEDGDPVYADGSELIFNEDGSLREVYTDENGNLTFTVTLSSPEKISLLGKTIRCYFENIGTTEKLDFTPASEGIWDFTVTLPEQSSSQTRTVENPVGDTVFTVSEIEVSPISIIIHLDVNGEVNTLYEDDNGIPDFYGFTLKDGTRLPYLFNGGTSHYNDVSMTSAAIYSAFDRVIDPEQISGILFKLEGSEDFIEVPL